MKGILFKPAMLEAIEAGRKTVTRRLDGLKEINENPDDWESRGYVFDWGGYHFTSISKPNVSRIIKPRYQVGEVVYLKEGWRVGSWNEDTGCIAVDYKNDGFKRREWLKVPDTGDAFIKLWRESTDDCVWAGLEMDKEYRYTWPNGDSPCRWRSPMFMPAWAARRFLRIKSVRPERLQEITEEDVKAEGIRSPVFWHLCADGEERAFKYKNLMPQPTYCAAFANLWDTINKPPFDWDGNPWVFRYEFEKAERPDERD